MCGIAGFIDQSKSFSTEALQSLAAKTGAAIQSRGPNHQGVWVDEQVSIALAHQRLSIIDCSPNGHQPMMSTNQRYVIAYNGEIYNFKALQKALIEAGETFRGHSDTEVLISAFSCWGIEKTLQKINGMFAIALWDRQEQQLFLIRDRMGQKPLYYGVQNNALLFGSELKALRVHPAFEGDIDRDILATYTRLNYVPQPNSIYKKLFKVPQGHYVRFNSKDGLSDPICYWDHQNIAEQGQQNQFSGTEEEAVTQLEALLKDAVGSRMISDVPLGAFLSGGIDSSLVVSLMQAQSSNPVKTFTIGFDEAGFNEANEAKQVAQHLGTDHTELYVSPEEARNVIPMLPAIYDEPFSDVSQIPTYLVSKLAREHVMVALSGDGGDEFFGGYNRHFWVPMLWRRFGHFPYFLKKPILKMLTALSPSVYNRLPGVPQKNLGDKIYKLSSILELESPGDMYIDLISSWRHPREVMINATDHLPESYDHFFKTSNLDLLHKMMSIDARHYLPDDILVKVDRASMAVSLEARAPLLDHRIAEFAWTLPSDFNVEGQVGKKMLKRILAKYVPTALIDRPKMGFGVPIGDWLRGPLKEWAGDLLESSMLQKQGFFDPMAIRQKWFEHQSNRRNWQYCLWNILMFQCWLEYHSAGVYEKETSLCY